MKHCQLPNFTKIRLNNVESGLKKILTRNRLELSQLIAGEKLPSWEKLMMPLEEMEDRLQKFWSPIQHLHSVKSSKALQDVYNRCLPELSHYSTELYQNAELYKAILALSKSTAFKRLSAARRKIIRDKLRDFKLSGVALNQKKKARFKLLQEKLSQLSTKFAENVLASTQNRSFNIRSEKKLEGLPPHTIQSMRSAAQKKKLKGCAATLDFPIYVSILRYADNRGLREKLYKAYATIASDQGGHKKAHDNTKIMRELLAVRCELAALAGFKTYADYSLATKMAKKPKKVFDFLYDLARRAKPSAKKELKTLEQFARKNFGVKKLRPWDIAYYGEKLKKRLFDITQEELRPYFPETQVLSGLFEIIEKLYGLKVLERKKAAVWHPDVQFFEIYDKRGGLRGGLYMDLYVRQGKRSGAWMDEYCGRRQLKTGKIQYPIAYLTCNFDAPLRGKPSLLTHGQVLTLFHEFGHCLQHLLTQINDLDVSGISGVEWDAVELPSQFMENFCWQPKAIPLISKHHKTGKPLPAAILENLIQSKNFQAGLALVRQLEFSLFDLHLYASGDRNIQKILNRVRKKVSVIKTPRYHRFQNSFKHIFSGSYAAGYYSYLWAEVLSSDAFSRFEEEGIFNKKTGSDFLKQILEKGGSASAEKLFVNFRGRKPKIDALLRHLGL